MSAVRSPRWLMSFADLALLLLAFFVLLHARADGHAAAASMRAAFGGKPLPGVLDLPAAALFQPGEAVLRAGAAERLRSIGAHARATGDGVRVGAQGDTSGLRLDRWELTAARLAAIARGLTAGGLDARGVTLDLPATAQARSGPSRFRIEG